MNETKHRIGSGKLLGYHSLFFKNAMICLVIFLLSLATIDSAFVGQGQGQEEPETVGRGAAHVKGHGIVPSAQAEGPDAAAMSASPKNNSSVKFYGCTDYGDTVHCDPLVNKLKSYVVRGFWTRIYTPAGNPNLVNGHYSKALEMKSNRLESVEFKSTKNINTQEFSISFWIKPLPVSEATGSIVSHSNYSNTAGWYFQLSKNGDVSFSVTNPNGNITSVTSVASNNTQLLPDKFTHIVGTFDGSNVTIYKDGKFASRATIEGKYNADPKTPMRIGSDAGSPGEFLWSGVIDDFRIYNRTLVENEVKKIFLGDTPSSSSSSSSSSSLSSSVSKGLVGHWTFDTSNLTDSSGGSKKNDGIVRTLIASMAFTPDGRLFFSEKNTGDIRILKDDKVLEKPFAKISDSYVDVEQGLLGLVIDPLFEKNHFVYLYYTAIDNNKIVNRLVRFTDANNTATDRTTILDNIPAVQGYHSGGALAFGSDDKLYIGVGDATNSVFAQNPSVLLGKVLRINRDGTIPDDNPYPNSPVYTRGHRNIYGIAFDDRHGFGIIAENGDAFYDEINLIKKAGNYGFPTFQPPNVAPELANSSLSVLPLRSYWRTPAPTQTIYYEGAKFPELKGRFLFGAFDGNIYALKLEDKRIIEDEKIALRMYPYSSVIALAQSPAGDIYFAGDAIYKLKAINSSNKEQVLFPVEISSPSRFNIIKLQAFTNQSRMLMDFGTSNESKLPSSSSSPLVLSIKIPKKILDNVSSVTNISNEKREALHFTIDKSYPSFTTLKIQYSAGPIYHLEIIGGNIETVPSRVIPGYFP
jgi:glucose/arabinose dehydrogenase